MNDQSKSITVYLGSKIFDGEDAVYESLMKIKGISHMTASNLLRHYQIPRRSKFKDIDVNQLVNSLEKMNCVLPKYLLNQRSTENYGHDLEKNIDIRTFASKVWHRINRTYIGLCISCGRKRHGQRSNRRRNKRKTYGK